VKSTQLKTAATNRVDWRPAGADMQFLGIDEYLADLNLLVDRMSLAASTDGTTSSAANIFWSPYDPFWDKKFLKLDH
jgi:hypothetical protein